MNSKCLTSRLTISLVLLATITSCSIAKQQPAIPTQALLPVACPLYISNMNHQPSALQDTGQELLLLS